MFTAEDGKKYVYDAESRQWLTPDQKIEDELQALVNQSDIAADANLPVDKHPSSSSTGIVTKTKKKKRKKASDRWVAAKENTWVYITGLDSTTTEDEVVQVFSKCGVIQTDLHTGNPRIKLYRNKETGQLNVRPFALLSNLKDQVLGRLLYR